MPISGLTRIQWSGVAAMLGGVLGIVVTPVLTFAGMMAGPGGGPPPMWWAQAVRPAIMPLVTFGSSEHVLLVWGRMGLPIYLCYLVGLLGLQARVRRHTDPLGRRGFHIARVGLVLNMIGNVTDYWLGRRALGQVLWGTSFAIGTMLGTLIYTIGAVLLGVAILRTGAWPRWSGAVLICAPLLGISLLFWGVYYIPANFILGNSLGWLCLGYVLWAKGHAPLPHAGS